MMILTPVRPMTNPKISTRGFTLIETLVAIAILAIAVAGPLVAASRALVAAQLSRDQLVASYLAQEGIEYLRYFRDNAYLAAYPSGVNVSSSAWSSFLTGPGGASNVSVAQCRTSRCMFDIAAVSGPGTGVGRTLEPCSGASCRRLYLVNAGGTSNVYTTRTDLGGTRTKFTRTVQVNDIPGTSDTPTLATDKRASSTVTWSFHGTTYSVTVTNNLTPWQ